VLGLIAALASLLRGERVIYEAENQVQLDAPQAMEAAGASEADQSS